MKYISYEEIVRHRIGYSQSGVFVKRKDVYIPLTPSIVYPVFDVYNNLLLWQARYMGLDKSLPKYYTRGDAGNVLHILGKCGRIVLVEDLLSAIKVSRVCRAVPLFGSNISDTLLRRLLTITNEIGIWLDKDKYKYQQGRIPSISLLFRDVKSIQSEKDPKEYDESTIQHKVL